MNLIRVKTESDTVYINPDKIISIEVYKNDEIFTAVYVVERMTYEDVEEYKSIEEWEKAFSNMGLINKKK